MVCGRGGEARCAIFQISEYYKIKAELRRLEAAMHAIIIEPINSLPFLNPGRLVQVKDQDMDWGWGLVAGFQKVKTLADGAHFAASDRTLLPCEFF